MPQHPYLPQTLVDVNSMLNTIGVSKVEDLFDTIPEDLRFKGELSLPKGITEPELKKFFQALADKNASTGTHACYLGAGAYEHYSPSVIRHLAGRSEFYTSYTPYQPEMTQGVLQCVYEYQSCICALTGMDISNASLYEGGHALAEAFLMAASATRRNKIVLTAGVHPEYLQVLKTYTENLDTEIVVAPQAADGRTDMEIIKKLVDEKTAAVAVVQPSFFGCLEDAQGLSDMAHENGALVIAVVEPISLGILQAPVEYAADIVCGEGQPLGLPLSYGGPWLGFIACTKALMRRMPGRICGMTKDNRGQQGFVLTLQTREQHIRREKATSNICTNEALFALMATIYMGALGPEGIKDVARQGVEKAHYLAEGIKKISGVELTYSAPFFNEFVVKCSCDLDILLKKMHADGILAGVPLSRFYSKRENEMLVCVTETKDKNDLDKYIESLTTHCG